MYQQTKQWISPEEYLALERQAQTKSEYFAGEIFAMSGASRTHNLILTNTVISLDAVVPLPSIGCELRLSDVYDRIQFADPTAARGSFRIVKEEREEYGVA